MATLFNNYPYISSSKFSANWHATATNIGMVVEYCGHVMECICTVCISLPVFVVCCQPVHSCIDSPLHGLDLFLEIFLWKLVSVLFDKLKIL